MVRFGLTGGVLGHSLSSLIHKKLFEIKSISGEYEHYETPDVDKTFKEVLSGLDSFNITIPYKQDIMKHLDYTDETARLYDACNFVINKNGKYHGYNTDADGFLYALRLNNVGLSGKKVLVTGAGGVSHMLATTSALEGADVTVFARREEQAKTLCSFAEEKTGKKLKVFDGNYDGFDILLQGTPAGMFPNCINSPVPLKVLKNIPFVFDTIYNPVKPLDVIISEYYGNFSATGLSMLVSQAVKAHEIYFGTVFSNEEILNTIEICYPYLHKMKPNFNIILTGAPGCGKSTIGKELASLLGMTFSDLDEEIVKKEKRSINDIFATEGEDYFREKETEVLKETLGEKGLVISTGGGIVERNDLISMKKENDVVVYINTPSEELEKRLKNDISRPLLAENAVEKLHNLLKRRAELYKSRSDVEICGKGSIQDVTVSVIDGIINK